MKQTKLLICGVTLSAFALLAIACGGFTQGVQDGIHLNLDRPVLYQRYLNKTKKPPMGPDDLLTVATSQQEKDAVQAIKDGKVTIIWNVNLNDLNQLSRGRQEHHGPWLRQRYLGRGTPGLDGRR